MRIRSFLARAHMRVARGGVCARGVAGGARGHFRRTFDETQTLIKWVKSKVYRGTRYADAPQTHTAHTDTQSAARRPPSQPQPGRAELAPSQTADAPGSRQPQVSRTPTQPDSNMHVTTSITPFVTPAMHHRAATGTVSGFSLEMSDESSCVGAVTGS